MRLLLTLRAIMLIAAAWLITSAVAVALTPIAAIVVLWFVACCAAMDMMREIWDIGADA